jgi:hypothetical protein
MNYWHATRAIRLTGRAGLARMLRPPALARHLRFTGRAGPVTGFYCVLPGRHATARPVGQIRSGPTRFGLRTAARWRDPSPSLASSLRKSAPSRSRSPCCRSPPLPPRRRLLAFVLHATHCLARPPLRPVPSAGDGFLRHCLALLCP